MLQVTDLNAGYSGKNVLSDITFTLNSDEVITLVGPTGCGKTTILLALSGIIPVSKGEIATSSWVTTVDTQVATEARGVGMVFQDFALFPHLTVEENVGFRVKNRQKIDHWLSLLDLQSLRRQKPAQLSGGQKQRTALARTLVHDPLYILLDEPLSNLDTSLKDSVRWQIREALRSSHVPAIWVTHDQAEAMSVGDRVGVMMDGKLVQLDQPESVFRRPNSPEIAAFLGEAVFLRASIAGQFANTILGDVGIHKGNYSFDDSEVVVLMRPWDFSVKLASDGNGIVDWVRFEGETNLVSITLHSNEKILVRKKSHEHIPLGKTVKVTISSNGVHTIYPNRVAN